MYGAVQRGPQRPADRRTERQRQLLHQGERGVVLSRHARRRQIGHQRSDGRRQHRLTEPEQRVRRHERGLAMAWLPCPSPAYPATTHATAQMIPTAAITRDRFCRSTNFSTANCATTIIAVFAASAVPSEDVEIPAASTPYAASPDSNCP